MATSYAPIVRRAVPTDITAVLSLVDALADYEHLPRPTPDARERLERDLFGPKPKLDCWLVFLDGYPVGYAFALETYSSFLALPTMYLEDLFVIPEYRSRKAGLALFKAVEEEARKRGCGRMEWSVLNWNELAIGFYERLGAKRLNEWSSYRLVLTDGGF